MPHKQGLSRTTVPTRKPCCPDEDHMGKGRSRTTVPTHKPCTPDATRTRVEQDHRPDTQTLYPRRHTNKGRSRTTVPTRKPCTPDATQTRVGAGPPSRHANPAPQTPHKQGSEQDHRPDTQTLLPR